jgi:nicotinamidase/pyrazinamidase
LPRSSTAGRKAIEFAAARRTTRRRKITKRKITRRKLIGTEANLAATYAIGDSDALIVVDIQNDFCPDGALAVPRGDEVVPLVNHLAWHFRNVVLTQDWHPAGHLSFASSHPGRSPYDTIAMPYGPQVLWPDHCVQGTAGAAFHKSLHIPHAGLVLRKGIDLTIDSYSALYENDRTTPTGLTGYLRDRGISRLFIAGLALDFCVRYSVEDAVGEGFAVVVIEDACRGIDVAGSMAAARASFAARGVACTSSDAVGRASSAPS